MALAIEDAVPLATPSQVGRWVESLAAEELADRAQLIAEIECPGPAAANCAIYETSRGRLVTLPDVSESAMVPGPIVRAPRDTAGSTPCTWRGLGPIPESHEVPDSQALTESREADENHEEDASAAPSRRGLSFHGGSRRALFALTVMGVLVLFSGVRFFVGSRSRPATIEALPALNAAPEITPPAASRAARGSEPAPAPSAGDLESKAPASPRIAPRAASSNAPTSVRPRRPSTKSRDPDEVL